MNYFSGWGDQDFLEDGFRSRSAKDGEGRLPLESTVDRGGNFSVRRELLARLLQLAW